MVEMTPDLREMFWLEPLTHAIVAYQVSGNFKPINAKASTQDGLNPSHTVMDEIHAHKTGDLLNVLKSAAGARENALWLYTTTEGYDTPGPWPEMRLFAQQILQEIIQPATEVDHFLVIIFSLDDQIGEEGELGYRAADDDFDETKWIKANPLMSVNPILATEIRKAAVEAKQMPGSHAEFKIKRLNRQASSATSWLNIDMWKRCSGPVDLAEMEKHPCYAAIDGAATTDLMSFRLVWLINGILYTWGRRWVPQDAVNLRSEKGTVPYSGWVHGGYMTAIPGKVIDYAIVEKTIVELCQRFKPKIVAYDPWNIRDLVNRLKKKLPERRDPKDGTGMVSILQEFRQGPKSYHPAMTDAERYYLTGNLRHGNDPVLNWCAANVVPRYDDNMNKAPSKKNSADKIDDACAFFMAIGALGEEQPREKKFQLLVF